MNDRILELVLCLNVRSLKIGIIPVINSMPRFTCPYGLFHLAMLGHPRQTECKLLRMGLQNLIWPISQLHIVNQHYIIFIHKASFPQLTADIKMVVTSKLGTYVASFNIKSATYTNKSANLKHIQVLQMALHSQYYLLRIYPVSTKTFVLRLLFTRITNKLLTMRSHEGVLT